MQNLTTIHIPGTFKKYFKDNVHIVKGQELAQKLGNTQAANVVLVGAFSNFFPEIKDDMWKNALSEILPAKILDLNLKAFLEGKNAL